MKVVYNLVKSPLIFLMIGFFVIELAIFLSLFSTFIYFLEDNEEVIKDTLLSQSDEIFNSISFLINSKLNSVSQELLLFNQHINIKHKYNLENSKYEKENELCQIVDSKASKTSLSVEELNLNELKDKTRSEQIEEILNNDYLKYLALYTPNTDIGTYIQNNIDSKDICYAISFLKSLFAKNIISNQHLEKLNYTLYINNIILFYPFQTINDDTLKNLPFYNRNTRCLYSDYTFECSSIPNDLSLQDNIIYMDLKLNMNNLYINTCLNTNLKIYEEENENINNKENFFCIVSNLTNILEGINYDSNYFTFNIIQYNKDKDSINLLYSSNDNFYKEISLNKESNNNNLFYDEEYGKYQLKQNIEENIADLFHILYYEFEKNNIYYSKSKTDLIEEYEQNIQELKETIKNEDKFKDKDIIIITANQSFVKYEYNNKGNIDYSLSSVSKDEFLYIIRPVKTDVVKINKDKNIIDRDVKKIIFYTLTVVKLIKAKSSLINKIHIFICLRTFFYCLACEGFICIICYLLIFLLMRCILNPFKTFKASIEKLLDNNVKTKKQREKEFQFIKKDDNIFNKKYPYNNNHNQDIDNNLINYEAYHTKVKKRQSITERVYMYMHNYINLTSEVKYEYTNLEMKEIENIISFLQKILLLRDTNTSYQVKAEFYQSISSEISKKYQLDLFRCQLLIAEYYINDKKYTKAQKELENFQIRLEQCRSEYINKDKFIEKKNAFISTYNDTYINDYTNNETIKNDIFISIEMITEKFHYLMGLTNYFLFLELKRQKKEIINEYGKTKSGLNKSINDIIAKNLNININNTGIDINSQTNKITSQMDYHLEKAIKHFKEAYKINNAFKINQIKNIIILVYLSKCYIEFSNKSIEESNKVLKKAFLSLSNINKFLIDLTDNNALNFPKKIFNNNTNNNHYLFFKNIGFLVKQVIKKCYIDSRVMLIVNGSLIQMILYQIGKMALKMHKIKPAYFCFVKLIQISYFKNENIHFKAIKWLRYIINIQINKGKSPLGLKLLQFQSKRNNSNYLVNGGDEESLIKKSSIEYMKNYIKNIIEIYEKNKYKRREKKISKELLSVLDKKIDYNKYNQKGPFRRSRLNSKFNIYNLNSNRSSLNNINQDVNPSTESPKAEGNNSPTNQNDQTTSNNNNNNDNNQDKNIIESIPRREYELIIKPFIMKDLLIAQIVHSPIKIREEEKILKNLEKQYFRLSTKKKSNKCLIIILSEIFLQNFSSLKSFNLFMQYCIMKFLDDNDKIGYIFYSYSSDAQDRFYELELKDKALKKLDELFQNVHSINKNKNNLKKKKNLTDAFDIAMDMFNNEQLNNDYDIEFKTDKYIFCFGTLNGLRYKNFEASFSQTNRMNYMEISLYFFVFDSIENNKEKINHYKKYFKKFIEGFLIFVKNFKLIKLCFANICKEGKQKNLFSNKLECIKNII